MKFAQLLLSGIGVFILIFGCQQKEGPVEDHPRPIEVLFLGHESTHHNSNEYAPVLAQYLAKEGINLSYTTHCDDLNSDFLQQFDGLILYANHETITDDQEEALLSFVASGGGFIPIHCASFCFNNSSAFIDLVGGQFLRHDTGVVEAEIVMPNHPAMQNVQPFASWDETYVHHKLSNDRTVLMERVEGDHREPWTWVKDYGQGRVFYTAYGHNEKTWHHPGFLQLIKEAVLYVTPESVMPYYQTYRAAMPIQKYRPVEGIPNYEKRDPPPQFQEPLSPDQSKQLTMVAPGFEMKLFASEPDIINPITMDWDEKGRLWVVETVDYPNTVRDQDQIGDDRIKICEDTDGDGRADQFTIFAEGLNIPTSFVFVNGGIMVAQAPNFLFLKDTDGDDKADVKEVIMTGWGTFDTHAGPSNLQYGMDNQIWGTVGYSSFKGEVAGDSMAFRQGLYRFTPDVSQFEYVTRTSNNTWGLGISETNEVFASTANNTHSVYLAIPNAYYQSNPELPVEGSKKIDGHYAMHPLTDKIRQVDVFGGFTAAAGHSLYTARNYPESFWNKVAFVCEPTGNLVHMAKLTPDGAGFREFDGWNFVASRDEWFSPVEAKVGPDGNVWIADWYNFIVQHNPTPTPERGGFQAENGAGNAYVQPLRDKDHGRIWRMVPKKWNQENNPRVDLSSNQACVQALAHTNKFWRTTAQRILVESQDESVVSQIFNLIENAPRDPLEIYPGILHGLWTLSGLGQFSDDYRANLERIQPLLHHAAPAVRKTVVQILSQSQTGLDILIESKLWQDQDPQVQLKTLLALTKVHQHLTLGSDLYILSQDSNVIQDEFLSQALYLAASRHAEGFIQAYLEANGSYIPPTVNVEDLSWMDQFLQHHWHKVSASNAESTQNLEGPAQIIEIGVIKNEMKFDRTIFTVKAGSHVRIEFKNDDFMQHNLVIGQPNSLQEIGQAADKMAMESDAAKRNYVPSIASVLYATPLVNPEERVVLEFKAPMISGAYPFICTFPGHWQLMNGIMQVSD